MPRFCWSRPLRGCVKTCQNPACSYQPVVSMAAQPCNSPISKKNRYLHFPKAPKPIPGHGSFSSSAFCSTSMQRRAFNIFNPHSPNNFDTFAPPCHLGAGGTNITLCIQSRVSALARLTLAKRCKKHQQLQHADFCLSLKTISAPRPAQ